jgi:hypothetical protein
LDERRHSQHKIYWKVPEEVHPIFFGTPFVAYPRSFLPIGSQLAPFSDHVKLAIDVNNMNTIKFVFTWLWCTKLAWKRSAAVWQVFFQSVSSMQIIL